jgi:diguanylate cyclase (GGDEF)-like protein
MVNPVISHYLDIPGLKIRVRRPRWPVALLIVISLIVLVSFLDFVSGPDMSLSGSIAGLGVSAVSISVCVFLDATFGDRDRVWTVLIWGNSVQLGFFLLHTWVMSTLLGALREVRSLSLRDPLTGTANWRYFEEQADAKIRMARRNRAPITLAFIDLDNFKKHNDSLGHQTGNEVLKTVAASIQSQIRPSDILARLGGDEFGLLIDEPDSDEVRLVLDRLTAETARCLSARAWAVTLSVGTVTFRTPPESLAPIIKAADELMYQVKQSGKNRILYAVRD